MRIGAVLLASGLSRRFGGNKLMAELHGKPIAAYAMEAMLSGGFDEARVVTGHAEVAALAETYGIETIPNDLPELGQSRSIVLGTQALLGLDAICFVPGDQPGLRGQSLRRLTETVRQGRKGIVCLRDETHMGIPAAFCAKYYGELLQLRGDCGAKGILRAHEEDLLAVWCEGKGELADIDTREALAAINTNLK